MADSVPEKMSEEEDHELLDEKKRQLYGNKEEQSFTVIWLINGKKN
ncbi:MAG: hypothetical protein ACLUTA_17350 [Blautia wexlerae]